MSRWPWTRNIDFFTAVHLFTASHPWLACIFLHGNSLQLFASRKGRLQRLPQSSPPRLGSAPPPFIAFWAPTLALAFALAAPVARADNPSLLSAGPSSEEEARILWTDGKSDFEHGLDEDAIPKLERFIARYPGHAGYLEARHLLGRVYLRQREAAKAIPQLKAFIQASGRTPEALLARLELARADLDLELYSEALLTAQEAVKLTPKPAQQEQHAEALTLSARAQIGLDQDRRAQASIASAQKSWPASAPPRLRAEGKSVLLELKLRECRKLPSAGKLEEAQVRDQLGRRGSCLLESLLGFREVLTADDVPTSEEAEALVSEAFGSFWKKCQSPPSPPPVKPKDRDAAQLKRYFRELSVVLEEDCRQKIRQGMDLLKGWSGSASVTASESLKRTVASMEKLK